MSDQIIRRIIEVRDPRTEVLLTEIAFDAHGQECERVEYDQETREVTWHNVRDDLRRARELAAAGGTP